jgi:hypothetical protein
MLWKVVQSTLRCSVVRTLRVNPVTLLAPISSTYLLPLSKLDSWLEYLQVGCSTLRSIQRRGEFSEKKTNLECNYCGIEPRFQLFKLIFIMGISNKAFDPSFLA